MKDYVIEHLGGSDENTWDDITDWVGGMSVEEITSELARMFPDEGEDNKKFAKTIFDAVNQQQ